MTTGDGGFVEPSTCPTHTDLDELYILLDGEVVYPFANGDLTISYCHVSEETPYIASIKIKWQEDGNPVPLPSEVYGSQEQGGNLERSLCVKINGEYHGYILGINFDTVTDAKVILSSYVCEIANPAWCPPE